MLNVDYTCISWVCHEKSPTRFSTTWKELSQRIESAGIAPKEPSLAKISEVVKEVRKSRSDRSKCV